MAQLVVQKYIELPISLFRINHSSRHWNWGRWKVGG